MTDCITFLGCLTVSTTASVKVIFFKDGTVSEDLNFQNSNCGINGINYTFFF